MPKLTQKIDNLNRPTSIKEIKLIINNLPKQKAPGPNEFTGEVYHTFKEEIIPTLYYLFQRIKAKGILNHSARPASPYIPKPDKDITRYKTIDQYFS